MAYDEALASRIRMFLLEQRHVSERKMFGGLAFMVNGNMAVAASSTGGMMVRLDPREATDLLDGDRVRAMVMGGRAMTGWLLVASDALSADDTLKAWVDRGVAFATSLPPK